MYMYTHVYLQRHRGRERESERERERETMRKNSSGTLHLHGSLDRMHLVVYLQAMVRMQGFASVCLSSCWVAGGAEQSQDQHGHEVGRPFQTDCKF